MTAPVVAGSLTAIVILGAPNDEHGTLSSLALERCGQALEEYSRHPGSKILPTGGWGAHFNTTTQPHHHYVRANLLAQGVPAAAFVDGVESTNTIEDARLCRPIVERNGFKKLIVVTSDFHLARARFLFEREFPGVVLEFSAAETHLPADDLRARIRHEEGALARLRAERVSG